MFCWYKAQLHRDSNIMIYYVILFSGFLVLQIAGDDLFDVTKGWRLPKKRLSGVLSTSWKPCDNFKGQLSCEENEKFNIRAQFMCKKERRKVKLTAKGYSAEIGSYEVDLPQDKELSQGLLKSMCKSIFTDKEERRIIHFHNKGVWWCDMVGSSFERLDKCEIIDEEQRWMQDSSYKFAYYYTISRGYLLSGCPTSHPSHRICSKNGVDFEATYTCEGDKKTFSIQTSYSGAPMIDFAVSPNTVSEYEEKQMDQACRLFNAQVIEGGKKIKFQHFELEGVSNHGVWKCIEFELKNSNGKNFYSPKYKDDTHDPDCTLCPRFGDYELPVTRK